MKYFSENTEASIDQSIKPAELKPDFNNHKSIGATIVSAGLLAGCVLDDDDDEFFTNNSNSDAIQKKETSSGNIETNEANLVEYPSNEKDAAQFLLHAQFSASRQEINAVLAEGYRSWLDFEMAKPIEKTGWEWLMDAKIFNTEEQKFNNHGADFMSWTQLMTSADSVRKKFALAWSEIIVVSTTGLDNEGPAFAAAEYWDILNRNAFGNFRNLISEITFCPAMGRYLSSLNNLKENESLGRFPDENYAREILQLFTIGLYELNIDGTLKYINGQPVETYNQETISNLAKIFTGFVWDRTGHVTATNPLRVKNPMIIDDNRHSKTDVKIFGTLISGSLPPKERVEKALDIIFNHQNVAPFICRQLIQRIVTSNPSPEYVSRVAKIFENNGKGVRGDLYATTQAILMDKEARSAQYIRNKVREPMCRVIQWARTFGVASKSGKWEVWNYSSELGQSPLRSDSVFNFFRPGYVPPQTEIANKNLCAPEFQIINEATAASVLNSLRQFILGWRDPVSTYEKHLELAAEPRKLIDELNLTLAGGQLSEKTVELISNTIEFSMKKSDALKRVQIATLLLMASPEYIIQK